ncbi:hypothetical protein FIM02_02570 [SAR202 cluster bacterium AD-802-E10_MRT_200m]|nr:hypothetical protein [SAR202 cluster bacterium AD-802-E10_MRT_200m]
MGLGRIEQLKQDYDVRVDWKPFELKPGTPPKGIPRPFKPGENNNLTGHMKDCADDVGLQNMRRQPFVPNSRIAMQAALYAKDQNMFEEFHRATFKAFWEESQNIGDTAVLQEIFKQCELDWQAFNSPEIYNMYSQQLEFYLREPQIYGISAVPAFILDRYLIMGAQPYSVFQEIMEHLQK